MNKEKKHLNKRLKIYIMIELLFMVAVVLACFFEKWEIFKAMYIIADTIFLVCSIATVKQINIENKIYQGLLSRFEEMVNIVEEVRKEKRYYSKNKQYPKQRAYLSSRYEFLYLVKVYLNMIRKEKRRITDPNFNRQDKYDESAAFFYALLVNPVNESGIVKKFSFAFESALSYCGINILNVNVNIYRKIAVAAEKNFQNVTAGALLDMSAIFESISSC